MIQLAYPTDSLYVECEKSHVRPVALYNQNKKLLLKTPTQATITYYSEILKYQPDTNLLLSRQF